MVHNSSIVLNVVLPWSTLKHVFQYFASDGTFISIPIALRSKDDGKKKRHKVLLLKKWNNENNNKWHAWWWLKWLCSIPTVKRTEERSLFCMIHFKCIFIAFFNTLTGGAPHDESSNMKVWWDFKCGRFCSGECQWSEKEKRLLDSEGWVEAKKSWKRLKQKHQWISFFLLELFKQSTEKYLMNGGWGRLIKYSHHTDAFYRRSFHLLLVYLLASIIALRLFVLDLQRFILGKINSSPSRSDFTWKLEMITAIFLSTNESNEMKRNRSYFIVDSSITPSFNDRIKLFTSPPPQKKENKNRK